MQQPNFSQINPDDIVNNINAILNENKKEIKTIVAQSKPTHWDSLITPLETVDDKLHQYWSLISHLNSVMNTPDIREAYNACLPSLSEYSSTLGQDKTLYEAYLAMRQDENFQHLDAAQQKILNDTLRDFQLAGVHLDDEKKKHYKALQQQLSKLTSQFEENVLDATKAWSHLVVDQKELAGLPESAVDAAKEAANNAEQVGWLFNLEMPSFIAVMTYADSRSLREKMYTAYTTRASDQGPFAGKWDNSTIIEDLLKTRLEIATLLGFDSYAELSLTRKMASNTQEVLDFLEQLVNASLQQAKSEYQTLADFIHQQSDIQDIKPWDIGYYSEKLKQELFHFSQEELRPYFPENAVIDGLFSVVNTLFGITIKEKKGVDTWHKDVRFFDIFDEEGTLRGSFYFDLYARTNKRGGAWMDDCRGRRVLADGTVQTPIAFLTCNLNKPVGNKPALFTHDEVITIFHEFGHGIHHMLTQVNYADAAGMNGVPWDAVELPSQFLEFWAWEREALDLFAKHVETGKNIPDDLFNNMTAAKNFQSAMTMVRQLEFALFDFRLHMEFDPKQKNQVQKILDEVRGQVSVTPQVASNRFQNGFSHIFSGGYCAGYYSYKWAEVLASDAFSKFEETGIFNHQTGLEFLHHILEKGGSEEPMALFIEFRGRKPSTDALLRHNGILKE